MALKFLERLENPNHPSMGPIIWGLKAAGMWKSDNTLDKAFIVQTFAIITFATEVTELWFLRSDITSALRNISFTTLRLVCVVKSGSFVLWNKCWKEIIEYVSGLEREQLSNPGEGVVQSMELYIRYSRRITYLYWGLTYSTVLAVILSPLVSYFASAEVIRNGSVPYPEIISSWVPFDKTRGCGYAVLILIQAVMLIYGGITVASYDSNAVALMTFFAGQLNILRENCKGLFDGNISKESSMKKIRGYHKNYVDLIKYSKMLNSVLSPVLFLYVIICSLMICASAIQITKEGTSTVQKIWIAEYFGALILQLLLYCWHSNEVYVTSLEVSDGVYMSSWFTQDFSLRQNILLLSGQLKKTIAITAGPFTKLNIATFITIIKGSYTYYTVLSKK